MTKRSPKRNRTRRRQQGGLLVTERDRQILILTGLCGYLSTDQIAREFFPSVDRARQRIRQLYDANLINITLWSSTKPNLVSLASRGRREVLGFFPELATELKSSQPINQASIEHHLLICDCRLYCSALGTQRGSPLSRWSAVGGELGWELELEQVGLQPDALAEFGSPQGPVVVAVEADCGTEALPVLASKLERYAEVAEAGQVDALWLVAKAGKRRLANIWELVKEAGLDQWTRLMTHKHVVFRPVLELPAGRPGRGTGRKGPNTPLSDE